jgi:hypothetical protein
MACPATSGLRLTSTCPLPQVELLGHFWPVGMRLQECVILRHHFHQRAIARRLVPMADPRRAAANLRSRSALPYRRVGQTLGSVSTAEAAGHRYCSQSTSVSIARRIGAGSIGGLLGSTAVWLAL